nr:hypothetical protein [Candidatus Electrothrix aestuarii]
MLIQQRLQIDNKELLFINQDLLLNKKGVLFDNGRIKANQTRCARGFRNLQALFTSLSGAFTS